MSSNPDRDLRKKRRAEQRFLKKLATGAKISCCLPNAFAGYIANTLALWFLHSVSTPTRKNTRLFPDAVLVARQMSFPDNASSTAAC